MLLVAQNIRREIIPQFSRGKPISSHLGFECDPHLGQDKVNPRSRSGNSRTGVLWLNILEIEVQHSVDDTLKVVFIVHQIPRTLVQFPSESRKRKRQPSKNPLKKVKGADNLGLAAKSLGRLQEDLLLSQ